MNLNYRQKALAYLAIIIAAIATGTALVIAGVLNWAGTLFVVAFGCLPLAKYVWQVAIHEKHDTIRILKAALPKCGFSIRETEWNDDKTAVRFHGQYQGDNFTIQAAHGYSYVEILDLPWSGIKSSDPAIGQMMEAINETNASSANMSVILCEPNEEGVRQLYTLAKTILPTYRPEAYLDSLMCDMLNRKKALHDNFAKPRPWMETPKRGPVGFNVAVEQEPQESQEDEARISPAARKD